MIKVNIESNKDGFINIHVKGHGNPIVCAAVSALTQSTANYLSDLAMENPNDIQVNITEEEESK